MRLDVRSLRRFSHLAHTGAERAAGSLSTLTGIDTYVDVTRIELSSQQDVDQEFRENDFVSVSIGLDGAFEGQTILAFSRESATHIVETLMPGTTAAPDDDIAVSSLNEVGNIMIGGFVDGWADFLGGSIDISTPTYVDVEGGSPVDETYCGENDSVLVFRNQLEATDDEVEFFIYMVPSASSVGTIVDAEGDEGEALPLETFRSFSTMIGEGAEQASEDISMMTAIPTQVEVSRLSFVPIEGVPTQIDNEARTGVVLEFEGVPSGYIAILFDEESASSIASSLLPGAEDAGTEMRQSAIQEIGNIITSGFLDGWADALDSTIEISPPTYVNDLGPAILDPLVTELAQSQEFAFLIDSTIQTDDDEFTCDIYALPDERELRQALEQLAPA